MDLADSQVIGMVSQKCHGSGVTKETSEPISNLGFLVESTIVLRFRYVVLYTSKPLGTVIVLHLSTRLIPDFPVSFPSLRGAIVSLQTKPLIPPPFLHDGKV